MDEIIGGNNQINHLQAVQHERDLVLKKVTEFRKALDNIEERLNQYSKEKSKHESNIYVIAPNIKPDFEKLSRSSITFLEFMKYFEIWILQLSFSVSANKENLKGNRRLISHMRECLEVCRIVDYATKSHFGF